MNYVMCSATKCLLCWVKSSTLDSLTEGASSEACKVSDTFIHSYHAGENATLNIQERLELAETYLPARVVVPSR